MTFYFFFFKVLPTWNKINFITTPFIVAFFITCHLTSDKPFCLLTSTISRLSFFQITTESISVELYTYHPVESFTNHLRKRLDILIDMNAPYIIEKQYNATIYDYLASILRYCVRRKKDWLKTYIWRDMGMFPCRYCKLKGEDSKF